MKLDNLPLEHVLLALVVLGVFAAAFFFSQLAPHGTDQTLDGVRVLASGDAKLQLRGVLDRDPVLIRMELFAGNDSRNTALSVVTAEIASTLINYQKRNFAYGAVAGNASINCVNQTHFCQDAVVFVQIGPLNGMRINDSAVLVEGSETFFRDPARLKVIKGVFGLAASGS
jgi:hypothetical protein